jgi:outer membrane receptor for ferrienterochelin and colicins
VVVVTGTRTPESSQRSTVKTDVVTKEEADRRGATNVAEALASQSGVQVNPGAYGFLGNVSAIQIQGFDRDRVLILEDGERVVGDVGGAIDLAAIPTADLNRIEIVTGPTSSLYGSSALGGVVNLITAPPRRVGPWGRLRLEGRSFNGAVAQVGASYRRQDTWVQLDANYTRQDGLARRDGEPDLKLPESARRMFGVRAGTRLGKVDLRLRARWFRDRLDGLESQVAPGLGRYLVDLPEETNRYTLHAIEVLDLGRGSSLRVTLGKQWTFNETGKDRRDSPIDERRERFHTMHSVEPILTLADGKRTWVMGARAEVEHFSQDLARAESLSTGVVTRATREVPEQTLGSAAAYAQLQWKLFDTVTLLPGVRAEGHTRYGGTVAPRFATSLRPSAHWQVRASAGRGFRAPSAKELGFVFDHSFYGYRLQGNGALRPETSWGGNADMTYQPSEPFLLRAGGFANWVDDLIDLDLAGGTLDNGVSTYSYKNFGRARTLGATFDSVAQLSPAFRAEASYAYLNTRDLDNDRPLSGRPAHTVTTSILARPRPEFEIYARVRVLSAAFVSEELRAPGYATVDVRVSRTLWPKASAYVGVLNLLDQKQEPGRIGDTRSPLGRVFYVGIRAEAPWEDE